MTARVPWSMLGVCAVVGTLPILVGWLTYQALELGLDMFGGR